MKNNPRILIVNDDGVEARGIKILTAIARKFSNDVWIVAPDTEKSAASHALTITRPLRLNKIDEKHYSVDGTPTDCVLMAVSKIMQDKKPDLLWSGINNGGNLSDDISYSGTVAAAIEGTILGIPSVALSQCYYEQNQQTFWETAEHFGETVLQKILQNSWPRNVLINVNFPPCLPEKVLGMEVVKVAKQDFTVFSYPELVEIRTDPRGQDYFWVGGGRIKKEPDEASDLKSIINRKIAITPLSLNMTDENTLLKWQKVFNNDDC